jgi:hypothetical protein
MSAKRKKVDKIDTIKSLLLKRIEYHSNALEELRRRLKQAEAVEAMLPDLADADDVVGLTDPPPGKPYSNQGLTDAVKLALIHAGATPKTLRELRDMLTRGGYLAPKSHFSESLNATLHRLVTQGLVTVGEDTDGRKTFVRKI